MILPPLPEPRPTTCLPFLRVRRILRVPTRITRQRNLPFARVQPTRARLAMVASEVVVGGLSTGGGGAIHGSPVLGAAAVVKVASPPGKRSDPRTATRRE